MNKYQEVLDNIRELKTKMYVDFVCRVATKGSMIQLESAIDDSLNTLQELVEKATPKKPDKYVLLERDSLGFPTHGYCKTCGTSLLVKNNYCGRCGQALDWSDKNDV